MIKYLASISLIVVLFAACKADKKEDTKAIQEKENKEFISKLDPSYPQIGLNIAFSTKSQISKNLFAAISKGGTTHALSYCNSNALAITDSMATLYQASIKRVSDKTRNPSNKANDEELEQINHFKIVLAHNEVLAPVIKTKNDSVSFYYPIVTNNLCLQCHGTPQKDITENTLATLKQVYPNDQAIGYSENEVRGIWSIRFKKKEEN